MRIAVFCGSADGRNGSRYKEAAFHLGQVLAGRGVELVYGGARVGLMGAVASGALSLGGKVIGVLPRGLADRELAFLHGSAFRPFSSTLDRLGCADIGAERGDAPVACGVPRHAPGRTRMP